MFSSHYIYLFLNTAISNMPIDKGGRHMLTTRREPYQVPTDSLLTSSINPLSSFYVCQPANFFYTSILCIHGSNIQMDAIPEYILENRLKAYIVPVSGKVLAIEIFPNDAILQLNGEKIDSLIGVSIKAGDKLVFLKNKDGVTFNAQLVLRCALESNE